MLGTRLVESPCCATRVFHRDVRLAVRCVAEPASGSVSKPKAAPFINEIPKSRWPNGIPPVMGAHLMASDTVAPISTSKGAGIDLKEHQFQYPDRECGGQVLLVATAHAASVVLANRIAEVAKAAIAKKGSFTLVLSGGSLINSLSHLVDLKSVDWSKVYIFWVDERNVPLSSADSNYHGAQQAFLSKVPIPESQVFAIGEGLSVKQAATNYEGRLLGLPPSVLPHTPEGFPVFDLILLGIGPDGHVASLFPNRPETAATEGWVLPVSNSPKPPPERITFTLPVINSAANVFVVALGDSKAEIVQRILEVQALPGALPAQLVRPTSGNLVWMLDVLSAQHLDIANWDNQKNFPRSSF